MKPTKQMRSHGVQGKPVGEYLTANGTSYLCVVPSLHLEAATMRWVRTHCPFPHCSPGFVQGNHTMVVVDYLSKDCLVTDDHYIIEVQTNNLSRKLCANCNDIRIVTIFMEIVHGELYLARATGGARRRHKRKGIGNNYHATIEFDFKNKD